MVYKGKFYHQFFCLFCDILRNKTIFIAPLDWGLGHATRCVPLIKQLREHNQIILGVTEITSCIFDEEFPDLKKVNIESYRIRYSKKIPLGLILLLDSVRILKVIKKENQQLKKIINDHKIDVIISDNRFGLYNNHLESIYITHQLNIHAGLFSFFANKIHHHYIEKFNQVWVPDFEDQKKCLAGMLSRNKALKNITYMGPLSRLPLAKKKEIQFDYLCLLSGPEPLRTELELLLIEKAKLTEKKIGVVRGSHLKMQHTAPENLIVIDMPTAENLSRLIQNSNTIICRSGYSTLMDLHHLKQQSVILIPTPGQFEQSYLADYWQQKFGAKVILQKDLPSFSF